MKIEKLKFKFPPPVPARHTPGRPAACQVGLRTEHLLETATRCFMENGYAETNVGEIARRAGASKQTIYSRYPAKADLFKACINRLANHNLLGPTKILVDEGPVEKVLERFGLNLLEVVLLTENQLLRRAILGAIRNFPGLAEFFWENGPARAHGVLADYLRRQVRLRNLKIVDPMFAAELFCFMCVGPFMLRIELNLIKISSQKSKVQHIREVVRIFTAAYFTNTPNRGLQPRQISSDVVRRRVLKKSSKKDAALAAI